MVPIKKQFMIYIQIISCVNFYFGRCMYIAQAIKQMHVHCTDHQAMREETTFLKILLNT